MQLEHSFSQEKPKRSDVVGAEGDVPYIPEKVRDELNAAKKERPTELPKEKEVLSKESLDNLRDKGAI